MTTAAFTKRGMERQELFEDLMRDLLMEEERRDDPTFLFGVTEVIFEYLQQRRRNSPRHAPREITEDVAFCVGVVLERIRKFSRSQVEDDALVAELFEKIVQSATVHFRLALQMEESSIMAEVLIEGSS